MAFLAPVDGILNVWVGEVQGEAKPVTQDLVRPILWYGWAFDNEHLLYTQDIGGDENHHLFRVDPATGEVRDLTPFPGVQVVPVGGSAAVPGKYLIAMNLDDPAIHDAYLLEVESGELVKVADHVAPQRTAFDTDLTIRATERPAADGGKDLLVRDGDAAPWRVLAHVPLADADPQSGPLAVPPDGSGVLVLTSVEANALRLVELDVQTGDLVRVVWEDPTYDVTRAEVNPTRDGVDLLIVARDRARLVGLTEQARESVALLESQLSGDLSVVSRDALDQLWLVADRDAAGPTTYHLFDRRSRSIATLFTSHPQFAGQPLQPMEPFSFSASDGLVVHGYLTFPPGVVREGLPGVVWVHGGPWARDYWGMNPFVQLMANRGYLCVQVNYRGSTGYGKAFLNAGNRQWAGAMHQDLVDAVGHLVQQGILDPERVAIGGGSYGGYAALVGATFTPDLFCAAIDLVGPSNLNTLIKSFPPYWGPTLGMWHERVGNPEADSEFLWSRSPLSRVDDIVIPMLIAQGANDPRVTKAESDQIVAAMRARGIPHEYLVFEDEGHGFARPDNLLRFVAVMEAFLAEHLGGAHQTDPAG